MEKWKTVCIAAIESIPWNLVYNLICEEIIKIMKSNSVLSLRLLMTELLSNIIVVILNRGR